MIFVNLFSILKKQTYKITVTSVYICIVNFLAGEWNSSAGLFQLW